MLDAADGNLDPAGTTHAYAKSARIGGAEIYLKTRVTELQPRADGSWDVVTENGTIHAEHVVNCGGLWAREIGRMVGIELPVLAMEHMYLVTDDMPEVIEYNRATGRELPHAIDFKAEIYMRQERNGMVLGTYEKACVPWQPRTTPWDFGAELLPPDLDRIAPSLELGFQHFPAMEHAGIKRVINGPFTFSPDGNPLVGPVQGLRELLVRLRRHGRVQPGRRRRPRALAMDGATAIRASMSGPWTSRATASGRRAATPMRKCARTTSRRFSIRFPNEELPAARPQQTTALYDALLAAGRRHGRQLGPRDAALVRAARGRSRKRHRLVPSLERLPACEGRVPRRARRRRRHRDREFREIRVLGTGRRGVPVAPDDQCMPRAGRLVLTPMLNPAGKLIGDFTIACAGPERFLMWGSSQAQKYHMRWFESQLPADGSVACDAST